MNKINKILIIIIGIILFINNYVYGSFADYTDEDAEKEVQVLIKEHEKNFDSTKSENNFLKSLSVSSGILAPDFDKQIIEYTLRVSNNINEIDITANPEDEKAKINGSGKIKINDYSECKIEVIAESGTVRTYLIKIIKEKEESVNDSTSIINSEVSEENRIYENNVKQDNLGESENEKNEEVKGELFNKEDQTEYKKYIIYGIALIIVFIFIAIIVKANNKPKH